MEQQKAQQIAKMEKELFNVENHLRAKLDMVHTGIDENVIFQCLQMVCDILLNGELEQ